MTTSYETTAEFLARTCTQGTYDQETALLASNAQNDTWYSWEDCTRALNSYRSLADSIRPYDPIHAHHVEARHLATGDWMDRIHGTADGSICVFDAVAVPHDYPF